jgi:hypothetical protein
MLSIVVGWMSSKSRAGAHWLVITRISEGYDLCRF